MARTMVMWSAAVLLVAGLVGAIWAVVGCGTGHVSCHQMAAAPAGDAPHASMHAPAEEAAKIPEISTGLAQAAAGKPVNTHCPIMGTKLDPANVPENLTRQWKGQTVGFCCAQCPPSWDKLSDAAKQEKLTAAMAKPAEGKPSGEHEAHHGG